VSDTNFPFLGLLPIISESWVASGRGQPDAAYGENTCQDQKLSELVNDFIVRLASVPPGPLTKKAAENVDGLLATVWKYLEGRGKQWNELVQAWTPK
jgi:hypothetical protein